VRGAVMAQRAIRRAVWLATVASFLMISCVLALAGATSDSTLGLPAATNSVTTQPARVAGAHWSLPLRGLRRVSRRARWIHTPPPPSESTIAPIVYESAPQRHAATKRRTSACAHPLGERSDAVGSDPMSFCAFSRGMGAPPGGQFGSLGHLGVRPCVVLCVRFAGVTARPLVARLEQRHRCGEIDQQHERALEPDVGWAVLLAPQQPLQ